MSPGITQRFLAFFFNKEHLICELDTNEKVIYLTFDDGPIPEVTPDILRILKERNCKATFFCIGDNARKYPEILEKILLEGHGVGNHSFHHLNGWKTPTKDYIEDVHRCNSCFSTLLFRPPYGRFTLKQYYILRKKYRFILWSALTGDYSSRVSPQQCLKNATDHTRPGSIIVFHDNLKAKDNVLFTLPRYLDYFLEKGYRFEKIGH
ncbi:MAG: polysaccharide deacetylase family protein [Bacteroidetes bacterium]|nr:polysaccharide deacetylase family protein [Bacteroidota bacterium]